MTGNDQDLRDRFAALRRDEETQAPEFAGLIGSRRERGRRRPIKLIAAMAFSAAMIAAALFMGRAPWNREFWRPHLEPGSQVASITKWKSPTDFLLETPGTELLRTVPDLGVLQPETKAAEPGNKYPQTKRKVLP